MIDREKVIKGLEICRHRVISQENCKECPYIYDGRAKQSNCEGVLHWDALDLLKEQPEIVRCKDCQNGGVDSTSYPDYWCSAHSEYHDGEFFCAYGKQKDS